MKKKLTFIFALALCIALLIAAAPAEANADGSVTYIDESGEEQTCTNATVVTADDTTWGADDEDDHWYVAQGDVTISQRVTVTGDVHLILADGASLTVNGGINVGEGNSFTVYAQSTGETMGKLVAGEEIDSSYSTYDGSAGIGGTQENVNFGNITIYGGKIVATGHKHAAGIGGGCKSDNNTTVTGTIAIHGGIVNATGADDAAGIGGGKYSPNSSNISITGGTVTATSGAWAAGIGGGENGGAGTINISGGEVTATSTHWGAGIGTGRYGNNGSITITGGKVTATGSSNAAGIGAAQYGSCQSVTISGGIVTAAGGYNASGIGCGTNEEDVFSTGESGTAVIFIDDGGNGVPIKGEGSENWSGMIFDGDVGHIYGNNNIFNANTSFEIPIGKTLEIASGQTLTVAEGVTITNNGSIYNYGTINDEDKITGTGAIYETGSVSTKQVDYIEIGGTTKTTAALPVTANLVRWDAALSEWYVVTENTTINQRIIVNGDVKLILADGATLTVNGGIDVGPGNMFTLYGQSGGTGNLTTTGTVGDYMPGGDAGIGGNHNNLSFGTINLAATGTVDATGGYHAAAIGAGGIVNNNNELSGTVNIYRGYLNANGCNVGTSDQFSIGATSSTNGSNVSVTINGGVVKAYDGIKASGTGVLSTGENGHAVIYTDSGSASAFEALTDKQAVIFNGIAGTVYGDVTVTGDFSTYNNNTFTVPEGSSLTIPEGITFTTVEHSSTVLTIGGIVTNNGTIVNNIDITGNLTNNGTITNSEDAAINGTVTNNGTIENNGTITAVTGNGTLTGSGTVGSITTGTDSITIKQEGKNVTISDNESHTLTVTLQSESDRVAVDSNGAIQLPSHAEVTMPEGSAWVGMTIEVNSDGATVTTGGVVTLPAGGSATIRGDGKPDVSIAVPESGAALELKPGEDGTLQIPVGVSVKLGRDPQLSADKELTVDPVEGTLTVPDGTVATMTDDWNGTTTITFPNTETTLSANENSDITFPSGTVVQTGDCPSITLGEQGGTIQSNGSVRLPSGGTAVIGSEPETAITAPVGEWTNCTISPNGDEMSVWVDVMPEDGTGATIQTGDDVEITLGGMMFHTPITIDKNGNITLEQPLEVWPTENKPPITITKGDVSVALMPGGEGYPFFDGSVTIRPDGSMNVANRFPHPDEEMSLDATVTDGTGSTTTVTLPADGGNAAVTEDGFTAPGGSTYTDNDVEITIGDKGGTVAADGSLTLTDGGSATVGGVTVTAPEKDSGTVKVTEEGTTVTSGMTVQSGEKTAITVGSNATVDLTDGSVTLPANGSATVGNTEITVPNGGTVTPGENGNVLIPGGSTVTTGDTTVTIPEEGGTLAPSGEVVYTVTVTFDSMGGSNVASKNITVNTPVSEPEAPTRSGYSFAGWYTKSGERWNFNDPVTGDMTLYARWSMNNIPDTYDIEVVPGEGGSVRPNLYNSSAGATITLTVTPDDGFELAYITVDGKRISGASFTMPAHDVTVRAYFTRIGAGLPFNDVNSGDWFYDAVSYVVSNGLMEGVSDTVFAPNATMSRAMVWAILARIDGETVTGANWIDTARTWAMANGVSDGADPNGNVTREQLATMLWRYAGEPASSYSLAAFTDADSVSDYAATAMAWAVENGIITGMTDTTLAPQGTATRAQCAAMLMRFVENV